MILNGVLLSTMWGHLLEYNLWLSLVGATFAWDTEPLATLVLPWAESGNRSKRIQQ